MDNDHKIKIGLLGLGTVGSGVVKVLNKFDNIEIKSIAVKNKTKKRNIPDLSDDIITEDPSTIINDPDIQILVEVIGGIEPAFSLIKQAMKNGKHIVTANKELLAKHGEELFTLAKECNSVILYEASVAGGIPIIMPLKLSLAANRISRIAGILNGTTNFILTKMKNEGSEFNDVLKEAQKLGYAEADPTGDVQGFDAAYKIAIIGSLAFNKRIDISKIYREGIENISPTDFSFASEFGYEIKLIALAQEENDGKVDVRVHPMLVTKNSPLASIDGVMNSVVIDGDAVGEVVFSGPGAGELPTASSVVGDILVLANELNVTDYPLPMTRCKHVEKASVKDIGETKNKFYIRLNTISTPGVIGNLGLICGQHNINLYSIIQRGILEDGHARIVLLTEVAYEKDIQNAIKEIKKMESIKSIENVIRVMD